MYVYPITHPRFRGYGQVLKNYDFSDLLQRLAALPVCDEGIVYEASVAQLEESAIKPSLENRGFGGLPIQIGYVGGNNKVLNCLEYHKTSEFNIALDDVVLVLGLQSDIENGRFDTGRCEAFLLPAGCGVELYGTSLHYAPMNTGADYRVACVLPRGTNGPQPVFAAQNEEDAMCAGSNKWLMAHPASDEAAQGRYIGLDGKHILSAGNDRLTITKELVRSITLASSKEVIIFFYGENVPQEEIDQLAQYFQKEFPLVDIGFVEGKQAVYDYIISLE